MFGTQSFLALLICCTFTPVALAGPEQDDVPLSAYFGFDDLELIRIGRNAGPIVVADMNGNGLNDIIVANNHASRIEIHYQKPDASAGDPITPPSRVNEFPEHWRYERVNVSVAHRVTSLVARDFDGDGRTDIIYAGQPSELVFLRQEKPDAFQVARRHHVRNLSTQRDALAIAELFDDARGSLIALAGGEIHIWPMDSQTLGQPVRLVAGADMAAFTVEDFNGDGVLDIAGVVPDDAAPIRVWFGGGNDGFGPQTRYEMPSIRAFRAVRLPGHDAARMAAIEQASRRLMVYELTRETLPDTGTREAAYHVHSFNDPGNRKRHTITADIDGNGLPDVITTDTRANAVVVYRQVEGAGLQAAESYPSLADIDRLAAGRIGSNGHPTLFVLSEGEGVVGRCTIDEKSISFPQPLTIADGFTPVTMTLFDRDGDSHLAVLSKSGRDHILEVLDLKGDRERVELGTLARSPETILAFDADQDGRSDLLLFTRDRPMIMLRDVSEAQPAPEQEPDDEEEARSTFERIESDAMGQYGLVQAARAENTALYDIDGNGHKELLIADRNYIRALRYNSAPPEGISPGWQVVTQINATDSSSQLVSLAVLADRLIAADRANDRLVFMSREAPDHATGGTARPARAWHESESLHVRGFAFDSIHAGTFSGDGQQNVIAIGSDGLAVIRLAGERLSLREAGAWRSSDERQLHHHIAVGDVNGDGFTDLIALDSGEQMCDIFTFTRTGRLLHATSFKVFETRIFSGGASREYQPTQAIIADITGDGANDLIFTAHDRVLIYPQTVFDTDRKTDQATTDGAADPAAFSSDP